MHGSRVGGPGKALLDKGAWNRTSSERMLSHDDSV